MSTRDKLERERVAALWDCRFGRRDHVRVGGSKFDRTGIEYHGTAAELHGPDGACTCCYGRSKTPQAAAAPEVDSQPPSVEPGECATPVVSVAGEPPQPAVKPWWEVDAS